MTDQPPLTDEELDEFRRFPGIYAFQRLLKEVERLRSAVHMCREMSQAIDQLTAINEDLRKELNA